MACIDRWYLCSSYRSTILFSLYSKMILALAQFRTGPKPGGIKRCWCMHSTVSVTLGFIPLGLKTETMNEISISIDRNAYMWNAMRTLFRRLGTVYHDDKAVFHDKVVTQASVHCGWWCQKLRKNELFVNWVCQQNMVLFYLHPTTAACGQETLWINSSLSKRLSTKPSLMCNPLATRV